MRVLYDLWTEIDELGMNKCMKHDWLFGWILAWDCYAW